MGPEGHLTPLWTSHFSWILEKRKWGGVGVGGAHSRDSGLSQYLELSLVSLVRWEAWGPISAKSLKPSQKRCHPLTALCRNPTCQHSAMRSSPGRAFRCLRRKPLYNCVLQVCNCVFQAQCWCSSLASPQSWLSLREKNEETVLSLGWQPIASLGCELEASLVFSTLPPQEDSGESSSREDWGLRMRPENFLEVWRAWLVMADGTKNLSSLLRTMGWKFFSRMFRSGEQRQIRVWMKGAGMLRSLTSVRGLVTTP